MRVEIARRGGEACVYNGAEVQPQIQYARTSDGVNIAYWALGEGTPLISMPSPAFSHLEGEWRDRDHRLWYEWMARKRKLVRFDPRGSGLSQRDVGDLSIKGQMMDLEAVVDHLSLERFVLFAQFFAAPVAITYAVKHPDRLSHLLLGHPVLGGAGLNQSPQLRAMLTLLEEDWELFVQTVAHARRGWSAGEPAKCLATLMREASTRDTLRAIVLELAATDVKPLLPRVQPPTLVLYRKAPAQSGDDDDRTAVQSVPVDLASEIPAARLAIVDGDAGPPYAGNTESVMAAIDEFLGEAVAVVPHVVAPLPLDRRLTPEHITAREREILSYIAAGLSNQAIAEALVVTLGTVKTHINNLYGKLNVQRRTQALRRAKELSLLD